MSLSDARALALTCNGEPPEFVLDSDHFDALQWQIDAYRARRSPWFTANDYRAMRSKDYGTCPGFRELDLQFLSRRWGTAKLERALGDALYAEHIDLVYPNSTRPRARL